jgi:transcriptional regulator with XRE-family HTH domain
MNEQQFYAKLGQQIRDARMTAGLRQEDLAGFLGLSRSSVANIECGRQVMSAYNLVQLHGLLGLEFEGLKPHESASVDLLERRSLVEENRRLHGLIGRLRAVLAEGVMAEPSAAGDWQVSA